MRLARSAGFNLLGAALPALLAVVTVPFIVRGMGVDDYGLLALITSIVGYFAVLDINVTAGSTKFVAQHHAAGDQIRLNQTVSFGLLTYLVIGMVGMAGLLLFADALATHVFKVGEANQARARHAIQIAALGFAIGQVQTYLQSLPGALMRYDIAARVEASFGIVVPLATVALLQQGFGLIAVVWLRVALSTVQAGILILTLRRILPALQWARPNATVRSAMLSFSAYSFMSRLAALTYAQADKLIIGARVGMGGLTYFVVPATLANRVMGLNFRLAQVMFPHASALAAQGRMAELERDYHLASRYVFFLNAATATMLASLAYPLLKVWMGVEFANRGALILALVAMAQCVDALTNVPSFVNDGLGHPRVTGLFALTRAVVGLALVAVGVHFYGAVGAAAAHLLASIIMSAAFLLYVHGRTLPFGLQSLLTQGIGRPLLALAPPAAAGLALAPTANQSLPLLCASAAGVALLLAVAGYWGVLETQHRQQLKRLLKRGARPPSSP